MKIAESGISMRSSHTLISTVWEEKTTVEARPEDAAKRMNAAAAVYEGAGNSTILAARGEQEPANVRLMFAEADRMRRPAVDFKADSIYEMKARLLDKLLEVLNGKPRITLPGIGEAAGGELLDLRGPASRAAGLRAQMFGLGAVGAPAVGTGAAGTVWQRITTVSRERSEREYTAFRSQGLVVTEDGRSISFGVEFSMSRSFTSRFDAITSERFLMTDPLVINLEGNTTSVSDVKFRFDLDSDGKEEEISFAGEGSGFLALDANENGVIDDGSELFGTRSGDGFADLAAYDEDGNHWIDENDSVYAKLRVWTKDADGNDRLMDLKEANVGAIYLGSVSTEFSLNDAETNETNAVVRRTGVYLKETGEVGTLSHVDLRC